MDEVSYQGSTVCKKLNRSTVPQRDLERTRSNGGDVENVAETAGGEAKRKIHVSISKMSFCFFFD